ncbi:MAG: acylphosphatase [Chloracidobacterium sp.]|nr:acylphosphatase [Chloracidobacterium sp.]MCC6824130.1 acylphosphatase [Acidobacteriota bacterium]
MSRRTRMIVARHLFISGRVQGVGYRYFAQRSAARHQVLGFVRNLDDGRVEAWVEGSVESVDAFRDDMAAGPVYSAIESVEELVVDPVGLYSTFRIER